MVTNAEHITCLGAFYYPPNTTATKTTEWSAKCAYQCRGSGDADIISDVIFHSNLVLSLLTENTQQKIRMICQYVHNVFLVSLSSSNVSRLEFQSSNVQYWEHTQCSASDKIIKLEIKCLLYCSV